MLLVVLFLDFCFCFLLIVFLHTRFRIPDSAAEAEIEFVEIVEPKIIPLNDVRNFYHRYLVQCCYSSLYFCFNCYIFDCVGMLDSSFRQGNHNHKISNDI